MHTLYFLIIVALYSHVAALVTHYIKGLLRSYDGSCNENVTLKEHVLCVKLSVLRLFRVGHVVQNRRSVLSLAWHEWFSCKGRE